MNPKSENANKTSDVQIVKISDIVDAETAKARQHEHPSVDASTLPSKNHEILTEEAIAEANAINGLSDKHAQSVEKRSRILIQRILRVRESFETNEIFDEKAFQEFLRRRKHRAGGKLKNPWQRVVKLCMPEGTHRSLVSKYGYVVAALVEREIRADTVLAAFEQREFVEGDNREYSGLERFVRLYKQDVRPPVVSDEPKDPFAGWSKNRVAQSAFSFITLLYVNDMLVGGLDIRKILKPEFLKPGN